ncbi:ABC transporter ATP-binding protein [Sulfurisphaera ohwakuensis]|uniref:ABC-2 type transport system ATP-binding protein n=1 Tax=Sulfurisphaera ohwakuensis TaxID=69656 RepID=A0A7J9RTR9_SULOH|nr:ABC transporter ATP-binding protein [Sulfurisphaera ohwakuensis]MBB5254201.1 ABC-2 type transport system ATP-binding protein [Sulfurisphaera ohwakuensis]
MINEDVSFKFDRGILVILGPNGAGKTTLLRQIYGDLKCDKGEILIDGFKPNERRAKKLLGIMPQNAEPIFNLTVYDHIKLFAKMRGIKGNDTKIREMIKLFDLDPKKRVNNLSGGQKRKVMLTSVLALEPKYFILDEPTVGLDLESRNIIHEILIKLSKEGKGIILTTHYLEEAEKLADSVILFNRRILFDGSKEELIRKVFNEDIYVVKVGDKKLFIKKEEISKYIYLNDIEIRRPTLEELYYEFFGKSN